MKKRRMSIPFSWFPNRSFTLVPKLPITLVPKLPFGNLARSWELTPEFRPVGVRSQTGVWERELRGVWERELGYCGTAFFTMLKQGANLKILYNERVEIYGLICVILFFCVLKRFLVGVLNLPGLGDLAGFGHCRFGGNTTECIRSIDQYYILESRRSL